MNNQLCDHRLDQLRSFECYQMLLNYFILVDRKSFVHQSQHYSPLLLQLKIIFRVTCSIIFSNGKTKSLFTP